MVQKKEKRNKGLGPKNKPTPKIKKKQTQRQTKSDRASNRKVDKPSLPI